MRGLDKLFAKTFNRNMAVQYFLPERKIKT